MAANITVRRRKNIFGTPSGSVPPPERNDAAQAVTNRIAFELETSSSLKLLDRGLHDRRLKKLRNKLDSLAEDDWKYPTVESLIGLK